MYHLSKYLPAHKLLVHSTREDFVDYQFPYTQFLYITVSFLQLIMFHTLTNPSGFSNILNFFVDFTARHQWCRPFRWGQSSGVEPSFLRNIYNRSQMFYIKINFDMLLLNITFWGETKKLRFLVTFKLSYLCTCLVYFPY